MRPQHVAVGALVAVLSGIGCGKTSEEASDATSDTGRDSIFDTTPLPDTGVADTRDPMCFEADGGCKRECQGVMSIVDVYDACAKRSMVIGCSRHEATCTPPPACVYNELTGAIGWVNCSKPPPEWKPCPDVISEWALAGARPPCGDDAGTDALTGECSRSGGKGPTPTCAFGEICDFAGCSAGDSGRTGVPCGAIRCGTICECVPETSQCRCVAP